jgi:AraC-like DNA-binding protein
MTDEQIIDGLRSYDSHTTKEYFYGYCRTAYKIYDNRYQLRHKVGLDFYSLAHEYYISLLKHDFKPLLDKPRDKQLSSWMMHGFRFVILDALKAYNREFAHQKDEVEDNVLDYVRAAYPTDRMLSCVADEVAARYGDATMKEIAHKVIYAGYKLKEVAEQLGISPSAVSQRYKKMMNEVVTPFIMNNYSRGFDDSIMADRRYYEYSPSVSHDRVAPPDRVTPYWIDSLKPNEVFVFESNLPGIHVSETARTAVRFFGATPGVGVGLSGQSYAIPTMQGPVDTIKPYVDDFIDHARHHTNQYFYVTPIGCDISGFDSSDIAPLFRQAQTMENISLPELFLL